MGNWNWHDTHDSFIPRINDKSLRIPIEGSLTCQQESWWRPACPVPNRPRFVFSDVARAVLDLAGAVEQGPWDGCLWPLGDQTQSYPLAWAACEGLIPPPHHCPLCTRSCSPWLHRMRGWAKTALTAAVLRWVVEPARGSCWHRMQSRWLLSYHWKDFRGCLGTGRVDVSVIVLLQTISSQMQTCKADGAVNTHPTVWEAFTPGKDYASNYYQCGQKTGSCKHAKCK